MRVHQLKLQLSPFFGLAKQNLLFSRPLHAQILVSLKAKGHTELNVDGILSGFRNKLLTAHENILSASLIFQGQWTFLAQADETQSQILYLLLGVRVIDLLIFLLVETVGSDWEQRFLRKASRAKLSCRTVHGVLYLWNSHLTASLRTWKRRINSGFKGYTTCGQHFVAFP